MSRARHTKKAAGGMVYSGKDSNVVKEAEEKKHGGRVAKHMGKAHGEKPKHRMDKKARGGNATSSPFAPGSAKHPFSSAAKK